MGSGNGGIHPSRPPGFDTNGRGGTSISVAIPGPPQHTRHVGRRSTNPGGEIMFTQATRFLAALSAAAMLAVAAVSAAADEATDVVKGYLAAWNAHDSAAASAFMSDGVTYYDASVGTPVEGRDKAKTQVIDAFLNAAPDAVWSMTGDPIVAGGSVAFEWTFKGTNTGAWADGTAATGKPFSFTGMSRFKVEGGKIVYQADYYDALGFYKQLGLM